MSWKWPWKQPPNQCVQRWGWGGVGRGRFSQWSRQVVKLRNPLWLVRRLKVRGVLMALAHTPNNMNRDTFTFTVSPLRPSQVSSLFGIKTFTFALQERLCLNETMLWEYWKTWGCLEPFETCSQTLCECRV
jgi:hypothetical protein